MTFYDFTFRDSFGSPPQPVLEFSLLGIGIPAVITGAIYLLMRKGL